VAVDLTPKQALELWRAASVAALGRKHPDLTARQFLESFHATN
jgi:hypothetical protein